MKNLSESILHNIHKSEEINVKQLKLFKESEILNETTPYGFEEFIDYNDGKYDVKPGALDEVREKLLGAALLLWYMYEDKDIPNKERLQEIHDKIEEAADEIYNLNQGEE